MPNITGYISTSGNYAYNIFRYSSGPYTLTEQTNWRVGSTVVDNDVSGYVTSNIDLSKGNPIYGKQPTVVPNSVRTLTMVRT